MCLSQPKVPEVKPAPPPAPPASPIGDITPTVKTGATLEKAAVRTSKAKKAGTSALNTSSGLNIA